MLGQQEFGGALPVGRVLPAMLPEAVGVLVDLATVHALVHLMLGIIVLGCSIGRMSAI